MQRKLTRLHFVGIGGIGMAALAELLHARGDSITGSDLRESPTTRRLAALGVPISIGHDATRVGAAQAVVRSSAIPESNPELVAARAAGLPIVARGALLAEVMRATNAVAIGGSHGKTTTSAIVAHVCEVAGLDPTALIGGRVPRPNGEASPTRHGESDLLVAEVDESDGSFLLTRPVIAVLTNADPEHLDHYGTRAALLDAFVAFANSVPFWGATILGIDHPGIVEIAPRVKARRVTYGFDSDADLRIESIETTATGQCCRATLPANTPFDFTIPLPGEHNVQNALAAVAVALELEVPLATVAKALASFPGVARRFQRKGVARGVEIVDDYAHHPAEIAATLKGARSLHQGRITVVFQPHRYSRTRDCWDEFLTCFADADRVFVTDIYAASESPLPGIDAEHLACALVEAGHPDARHGGDLEAMRKTLPGELAEGDLVLTLGAGDVVGLGPQLLDALGAKNGRGA